VEQSRVNGANEAEFMVTFEDGERIWTSLPVHDIRLHGSSFVATPYDAGNRIAAYAVSVLTRNSVDFMGIALRLIRVTHDSCNGQIKPICLNSFLDF
jgi:hypothetical protein